MAAKRHLEPNPNDTAQEAAAKKRKKGFSVGPDNLPDGPYRRKVQRIKQDLIYRAKIKKSYAKVKQRELGSQGDVAHRHEPTEGSPAETPATLELHPARQAMIDEAVRDAPTRGGEGDGSEQPGRSWSRRRPKPSAFEKETKLAERRRAEAEERRGQRDEAQRQRQAKLEERERFRRAMAKARTGGRNGQRKLGRESKVLLERVKRTMGVTGGN